MTNAARKGQLHELLAVEGGLKGVKDKIREETVHTFEKKAHLFQSMHRKLEMFEDSRRNEETSEADELSTIVQDKLDYMAKPIQRYFDTRLQKEKANQNATADVIVDGAVMFTDLPVTFLLAMESELEQLRKVYSAIPTLQPGVKWEEDITKGKGIYKTSNPTEKVKTEQVISHKVLYEATVEHPAQIEKWSEQKPVGKYIEDHWSGMITPYDKSQLLERLDTVSRAFKKARQRANTQETEKLTMGKKLFDFIHTA